MSNINTHNLFITFGRHKGERWTRLPISYLKWLANEGNETAEAELKRRGTDNIPADLEISPHAINNASLRLLSLYKYEKNRDEGLYSWLLRRALVALPDVDSDGKSYSEGIKFVFRKGKLYSTLVTVMKHNGAKEEAQEG